MDHLVVTILIYNDGQVPRAKVVLSIKNISNTELSYSHQRLNDSLSEVSTHQLVIDSLNLITNILDVASVW